MASLPLRGAALGATLALVAACGGDSGGLALRGLRDGTRCADSWAEAEQVGSLPGKRKEVSGFVSSAGRENVAWMVRDSGNPPVLYSFEMDRNGKIRSREFPVAGASNGDWEDIAYTTDEDGRGHLWILDNINRDTAPKTIWEVLEPDPSSEATVDVIGRYTWQYPDGNGNHDTETLVEIDGRMVVVSKTTPSRAYRFDEPLDADRLNKPTLLGEVDGPKLVFGSTSGDGRLILTSSTRTDTVYVTDASKWIGGKPVYDQKMRAAQREAGDFFPHHGCDIVLLDEKEDVWLLRNQR